MGGCVTGNKRKKQNILPTDPKPQQPASTSSQPLQHSPPDQNPQLPNPPVCSPDLPDNHNFTFLKVPIKSPPQKKFSCQKCKYSNFSSIMKCKQCPFQSCHACTPLTHRAACPYPNWQYKVAKNQSSNQNSHENRNGNENENITITFKCCFCQLCCSSGYMECRNCKGIACSSCIDVKEESDCKYHCKCQFKQGVYTRNKCFYCCDYSWQSQVCKKCQFNTCQKCYQTRYLKKSTPNQSTQP